MSEESPGKRSLDQSDVDQLRADMHSIERLNAEADYIRLKLAAYRHLDYASKSLANGATSLEDAADFMRDVIQELTEREDPTT